MTLHGPALGRGRDADENENHARILGLARWVSHEMAKIAGPRVIRRIGRRLSVLRDGRIAQAIKAARRDATHRILTPVELLARIAALIPPPRHPFLRYHGVLAPASKWRADIVPREGALSAGGCLRDRIAWSSYPLTSPSRG